MEKTAASRDLKLIQINAAPPRKWSGLFSPTATVEIAAERVDKLTKTGFVQGKVQMYRKKNRLLALVEQKHVPLGIQMFTGSPAIIEVLGRTGYDFVMIDTEHSPANARVLEEMIRTAELAGLIPYVRVTSLLSEVEIRQALEAGAEGLFLPRVNSVEDIHRVASFAFLPPKGRRRICPEVRAANYSVASLDQYTEWNNTEIALIPIIETREALEDVDAICAHPDVKMLYFAPGNLAVQLGLGMKGMGGPELQAASRRVLDAAARHGVIMVGGPLFATPESCRKALEDGIRIFSDGVDTLGFRRFCEQTVTAVNDGVAGTGFTRPPAPPSGL